MTYQQRKDRLLKACDAYYNGTPIMTDAEYDKEYDEFCELYPNDPFISAIGAPPPKNSPWKKVKHKIPMCSCNKVNTIEEFEKWANDNGLADVELVGSEKLDGISLSIDYKDGKLVKGTTRGDGVTGEDITPNVLRMRNVNPQLPIPYTGSLRGEVLMEHSYLEELNKIRTMRGDKPYENVRNAASGIARCQDGQFTEYLYVEYYYASGDFKRKTEVYEFINGDLGLNICRHIAGSLKRVEKFYNDYETKIRDTLDHDIDGIVIEPDNLDALEKLGKKHNNYRGQIAWKFSSVKKRTTIKDVVWQIGNSGRLTPVAILEPVKMVGVTVQRASLHNLELFEELAPYKGAICVVSRRNDVIPYCESIEPRPEGLKAEYFKAPRTCPVCNERTRIDGVFLICDNEECRGGIIGNLKKWIKKLDLKGIGPGIVSALYDAKMLKIPSDFYLLNEARIATLEGFGPSSAKKIVGLLNSKKELTFGEFIGGLNIPNFSTSTAELLEKNGYTLSKIFQATVEDLVDIDGIGKETARAIIYGLKKKTKVIMALAEVGITIKEKKKMAKVKENAFTGKSVVFTGALSIKRKEAQAMVAEVGGDCPSSLSKNTDYLVIADPNSNSSKAQKARKFGTQLISEDEFLKMVRA